MKIPSVHTKKLDDRSKPMIHLGKEPGTKAYRLYNPVTKIVHVGRYVVFEEKKSWSWEQQDKPEKIQQETFTVAHEIAEENSTEEEDIEGSQHSESDSEVTENSRSLNRSNSIRSITESEASSEPRNFRALDDIYTNTEVELEDDELLLMGVEEPVNYSQAAKERKWREAMKREMDEVEKNGTWKLTKLPPGHKAIDLKWIFKLKKDTNGEIQKYKARIVAKGYVQKQGVDFDEIFAPVTHLCSSKLFYQFHIRTY